MLGRHLFLLRSAAVFLSCLRGDASDFLPSVRGLGPPPRGQQTELRKRPLSPSKGGGRARGGAQGPREHSPRPCIWKRDNAAIFLGPTSFLDRRQPFPASIKNTEGVSLPAAPPERPVAPGGRCAPGARGTRSGSAGWGCASRPPPGPPTGSNVMGILSNCQWFYFKNSF